MAIIKDKSFPSRNEDAIIHYDIYESEGESKGIILQVLHGMAETKERYEGFARYLSERGITVVVSAHRGHKGGVADASEYGYMGADGLHYATKDAHDLTMILKKTYPDHTYVLMGHSMGSLIARLYFRKYGADIDGLILCGAPSNNPAAGAGALVASLVGMIKGKQHRSNLINTMAFGSMYKKFVTKGQKPNGFEWLSANEENVAKYMEDEACGFLFSAQSYHDLFKGIQEVYSPYPTPLPNPGCPVLFVSGSDDPCGDYGVGVEAAGAHMRQQGIRDVRVNLYPGLRHEILLEKENLPIFEDIENFINTKCVKR